MSIPENTRTICLPGSDGEHECYRMERFGVHMKAHRVFILNSITAEQAVIMLLDGYKT